MDGNETLSLDRNNPRMTRRWILTAAFLLLLIPSLLFAQDTTIEFYGTIQSANTTAIVINGQIVDIQSAQINTPLTVGTLVRVQAISAADGSLTATEIAPVTPGIIPGIVEIDGQVTNSGTGTITVGTQEIDVSGAEINEQILQGEPVHVFAVSTAPGQWSALLVVAANVVPPAATPEIIPPVATPEVVTPAVSTPEAIAPISTPEVFAPAETPEVGEDFKITGALQSVTDADLVVNGQRLFIGGARIDGVLTVGAQVELEIRVINGQWVLDKIKVVGANGDDHGGSGNSGSGKSGDDGSSGHGGSNSGSGDSGGNHSGKGG